MSVSPNDDQLAIKNFQKLLQINTISSHGFIHGTYSECVELLKQQCEAAGIGNLRIWEGVKGKPILIATITGSQPELKSILFTGHYDVVPVDLGKWTTDPFGAQIVDGT